MKTTTDIMGNHRKSCAADNDNDVQHYFKKAAATHTPISVTLALTHRCTFRCRHCYLGNQEAIRTQKNRELSTNTILKLLEEMAAAGTLFLTLTGGDPMIRSDFAVIYEHAVKLGLLVTVFCNGSLITEKTALLFHKYPPRMVEVTIYGATDETCFNVTLIANSLELFTAGVDHLHNAGIRYKLKTMVMTLNVDDLPAIRQIAAERGVPFYHDTSMIACLDNDDNNGAANGNANSFKPLSSPLALRLAPQRAAKIDTSTDEVIAALKCVAEAEPVSASNDRLYICGAGVTSCFINAYGLLQPCLITNHIYADLQKESFTAGWNQIGGLISSLKATEQYPCNDCQYSGMCTGCPASFRLETGNQTKPSEFYCKHAEMRYQIAVAA